MNSSAQGTGEREEHGKYMSTSYSSQIVCGACGSILRNIPVMYEKVDIDWRCGRCLRRDKPLLEDHSS